MSGKRCDCTYKGFHNVELYKNLPETLAFVPEGRRNMPYFTIYLYTMLSLYFRRFTFSFILQTRPGKRCDCTYKGFHNVELYKNLPETLAFVPGGRRNMPYFTNCLYTMLSLYFRKFTFSFILQTRPGKRCDCTYKGFHNVELYKNLPETLAFVPEGRRNMPYFTICLYTMLSLYFRKFTFSFILQTRPGKRCDCTYKGFYYFELYKNLPETLAFVPEGRRNMLIEFSEFI